MGAGIEPVPVTGLAANFSPIPRMAPPPLGRLMAGAAPVSEPVPVASDVEPVCEGDGLLLPNVLLMFFKITLLNQHSANQNT